MTVRRRKKVRGMRGQFRFLRRAPRDSTSRLGADVSGLRIVKHTKDGESFQFWDTSFTVIEALDENQKRRAVFALHGDSLSQLRFYTCTPTAKVASERVKRFEDRDECKYFDEALESLVEYGLDKDILVGVIIVKEIKYLYAWTKHFPNAKVDLLWVGPFYYPTPKKRRRMHKWVHAKITFNLNDFKGVVS